MTIPYRVEHVEIPLHPQPLHYKIVVVCLMVRGPGGKEFLIKGFDVLNPQVDLGPGTLRPILEQVEQRTVDRIRKAGWGNPVKFVEVPEQFSQAVRNEIVNAIMASVPERYRVGNVN